MCFFIFSIFSNKKKHIGNLITAVQGFSRQKEENQQDKLRKLLTPNSFMTSQSMTLSEALVKKLTMDESVQLELEKQRIQKKNTHTCDIKSKNIVKSEIINPGNELPNENMYQASNNVNYYENNLNRTHKVSINEELLESDLSKKTDASYYDHETDKKLYKSENKTITSNPSNLENIEMTTNCFDELSQVQSTIDCNHEVENNQKKLVPQYSNNDKIDTVITASNINNISEINNTTYKLTNMTVDECLLQKNKVICQSEEKFYSDTDFINQSHYGTKQTNDVIPQLIVTSEDGMTSSPSFIDDNVNWEISEDGVEDRCFEFLSDSSSSDSSHDMITDDVLESEEHGCEIKITKTTGGVYKKFQMEKIELNLVLFHFKY